MDETVAIALVVTLDEDETPRKKRKWSKDWFLQRRKYGHTNLLQEIRLSEPEDFRNFLRMDAASFDELLVLVKPLIHKKDTVMRSSIPPSERLSLTLRYLASGNSFEDLKFLTAISLQAIGKIIIETCEAIIVCLQRQETIKMPTTPDEWVLTSEGFKSTWNFPNCLGAIDGKHIAIKKPPGSGSFYFNYKKFFSIVLMAAVNANYEFLMVDVDVNGCVSDGGVIAVTEFGQRLADSTLNLPKPQPIVQNGNKMPFVFVADDAFAMSENLLKPYGGESLDYDQQVFNYRLSRARRVSENAFGILSTRFGVFRSPIQLGPEKATTITLACCYLHNFLRKKSTPYLRPGSVDWEDANHEVHPADWRKEHHQLNNLGTCRSRNIGAVVRGVRDSYRDYFCTHGRVHWQDARLK